MSHSYEDIVVRSDDAIETLLEKAGPRPTPPGNDEKIVRDAVHAEWQTVTRRIRTRRHMTRFAIAASLVLGIVVTFNALQVTDMAAVQVATISKSHGSIQLLVEQNELREITDLSSVYAGQVIHTGNDAGIGMQWGGGGSLRVDKNTKIEFTSNDSVYLKSGRIYFDSQSETVAAVTGAGSGFTIETDQGSVEHLGTQYMTAVSTKGLTVSVREGEVEVDSTYIEKAVASAGQQMTVSGGARPTVVDFKVYGDSWNWIEATAPVVDADGRSVDEFLEKIARETGLQVSYESPAAKQLAISGVLKGSVDMAPRAELAFRMSGEDLVYRIDEGTIYVSSIDSASRP